MNTQRGVTLIELMIALALSVMLLMGITKIFSLGKQTLMSAESQMQHEEAGRLGLSYIRQAIRNAHYVPFDNNAVPIELSQLPGFPHETADCSDKGIEGGYCNQQSADDSDTLTVSYIYENENQFSCSQTFVTSMRIAVSFFVVNDQLMCQAYYFDKSRNRYIKEGNSVDLVKNIIGVKLFYYYKKSGVGKTAFNQREIDWNNVRGVKIAVIVTSPDRKVGGAQQTVNVFGNNTNFNIPVNYQTKVNKVFATTVQAVNYGVKQL
ncbi:prepilin-type N-terminal cleavage/methylation domain-containing protein [Zooshikella marina]|uniref:PilW family protein n=1 Tax=Zooshikella ganghwensis TaxID=202772 RepID=UPI001BAF8376|nr:prepilin-type N-terminal cleavage/methylation domain-containing protein [Zooshikella ganghwensis]MBU2707404.1 prepilin-type N-terminal cleavage/methylation domain-containing protein [Zooshikella ganghwensis]